MSSQPAQTFEEALRCAEDAGLTAPAESLPRLIGECERVKATLTSRLVTASLEDANDKLLGVKAAADMLGMHTATLYDKAAQYPFTVKNGRSLRFSRNGIKRWIARKAS